jgi:hypothetical protein
MPASGAVRRRPVWRARKALALAGMVLITMTASAIGAAGQPSPAGGPNPMRPEERMELVSGGRSAYRAKIVIDCTGDVAFRAGAPCEVGRPGDGVTQPMMLMFRMSNIVEGTPVLKTMAVHRIGNKRELQF